MDRTRMTTMTIARRTCLHPGRVAVGVVSTLMIVIAAAASSTIQPPFGVEALTLLRPRRHHYDMRQSRCSDDDRIDRSTHLRKWSLPSRSLRLTLRNMTPDSFLTLLEDTSSLSPGLLMTALAAASGVGGTVAGMAAGRASVLPRVLELETQLEFTQQQFTQSEELRAQERSQFEDQLFSMDQDYEQQTSDYQRELQQRMQSEMKTLTEQIRSQLSQKFAIQLDEARAQMLGDQLSALTDNGVKAQEELYNVKSQNTRLEALNAELAQALEEAQAELVPNKKVQGGSSSSTSTKLGWW